MRKTTCKNLRGACDAEIIGNTPDEISANSKRHVMEMVSSGDEPHRLAMESMMQLKLEEQQKWYEDFKNSFDSLPEVR